MFIEDLDGLFDPAVFATAATYNGATAVDVIFDAPGADQLGVVATNPTALGRAADFPAAAVGKTLLIDGTTYTIKARRPIDDGAIVLLEL